VLQDASPRESVGCGRTGRSWSRTLPGTQHFQSLGRISSTRKAYRTAASVGIPARSIPFAPERRCAGKNRARRPLSNAGIPAQHRTSSRAHGFHLPQWCHRPARSAACPWALRHNLAGGFTFGSGLRLAEESKWCRTGLGRIRYPLDAESGGYFAGLAPNLATGALYRIDSTGGDAFPDPASRFQPQGPHGPSEVIDPAPFPWSDTTWPGAFGSRVR
jgi:hypothetical protein